MQFILFSGLVGTVKNWFLFKLFLLLQLWLITRHMTNIWLWQSLLTWIELGLLLSKISRVLFLQQVKLSSWTCDPCLPRSCNLYQLSSCDPCFTTIIQPLYSVNWTHVYLIMLPTYHTITYVIQGPATQDHVTYIQHKLDLPCWYDPCLLRCWSPCTPLSCSPCYHEHWNLFNQKHVILLLIQLCDPGKTIIWSCRTSCIRIPPISVPGRLKWLCVKQYVDTAIATDTVVAGRLRRGTVQGEMYLEDIEHSLATSSGRFNIGKIDVYALCVCMFVCM